MSNGGRAHSPLPYLLSRLGIGCAPGELTRPSLVSKDFDRRYLGGASRRVESCEKAYQDGGRRNPDRVRRAGLERHITQRVYLLVEPQPMVAVGKVTDGIAGHK